MEYHQHRFEDASLLIFKDGDLIALFPANKDNTTIHSHQGLTYGGLLLNQKTKFKTILNGFNTLLKYLNSEGFKALELKIIPNIYCKTPSDELQYLMFLLDAKLNKRDTLSVVDINSKVAFSKDRIQGVKRAKKHELTIKEVHDFDIFWNTILIPNLSNKHHVTPVHSLEEITLLKQRFPKQIRQFNVYKNNEVVAGTTIFDSHQVAHSQYISANTDKNTYGSLDLLHAYLIENVFTHKKYFDFGISNENKGQNINEGLQYWKEGFGARTVIHDFYSVDIKNASKLNTVML